MGNLILAVVTAGLLVVGLNRPATRRAMASAAWVSLVLTVAWYSFCYYQGDHSFRVH